MTAVMQHAMDATTPADIAIIGGGMVGLSLACLLAQAQPEWRVALLEQMTLVAADAPLTQPSFDARSTAIAEGSVEILRRLGLWSALAAYATPIKTVQVSDRGHFLGASINAAERGLAAVGYVVPNAVLGRALLRHARQLPNLTLVGGASVTKIESLASHKRLLLTTAAEGATQLCARLTVLADGGDSPLRAALGIVERTRDYAQRAIICNVRYRNPHGGVAFERFTPEGPLALLPLGGATGRESALIWTLPHATAETLLASADAQFLRQLQATFGERLGQFEAVSARTSFALSLVQAQEQVRSRLVLIGNAAHFLHPVAGQGFNLSLRDCAALTETLLEADAAHWDLGSLETLQRYIDKQAQDQWLTVEFSHYLVKLFSTDYLGAIAARHLGLMSLELLPPLKHEFIAQTMGSAGRDYQLGAAPFAAEPDTISVDTSSRATPATVPAAADVADVVVIGAGLVGASAALAIAEAGARAGRQPRIVLIEPASEVADYRQSPQSPNFDPRVVALNQRSKALLQRIGVWSAVAAQRVSPYQQMQVWDGEGTASISFDAAEARVSELGHIVENSLLVAALRDRCAQFPRIELRQDRLADFTPGAAGQPATVTLVSGQRVQAHLVVGADGARSRLRECAGIATREWDYGHTAIVTTVKTERGHGRTAWQRFSQHGPLALLPLQHGGDEHYCSIVWSLDTAQAEWMMALNDSDFCQRLSALMGEKVGKIVQCDPRFAIKLRQCHAQKYVLANAVLLGDAAHSIHPLAGQGVNLGLADVAALVTEIERAWARNLALNEFSILRRYQRARMGENLSMMAGMELFKQLFGHPSLSALLLRNLGMARVQQFAALKKWIVRHALGRA